MQCAVRDAETGERVPKTAESRSGINQHVKILSLNKVNNNACCLVGITFNAIIIKHILVPVYFWRYDKLSVSDICLNSYT